MFSTENVNYSDGISEAESSNEIDILVHSDIINRDIKLGDDDVD